MSNLNATNDVQKCVAIIQEKFPGFQPKIGIILGSGLGDVSQQMQNTVIIDYKELPGFYITNIEGQSKKMHLGTLSGVPVVFLEGRTHLYEGMTAGSASIKTTIRTLKRLGCEILLTANAVGSLRVEYGPGNLMLIEDHLNCIFYNPLIGPNDDEFGERFVSMDNAYDRDLRQKMLNLADKLQIPLSSGLLVANSGPTFETHAEIRMYKMLGGHAVGMSTVPETIVARHCGLKVVSVCAITNLGAGLGDGIVTHTGTLNGAKLAAEHLVKLFLGAVEELVK